MYRIDEKRTRNKLVPLALTLLAALLWSSAICAQTQTTSFSYQGRLTDGGTAATGNYDFQFALFDNSAGGTQIGSTLTRSSVPVSGGVFTVQLDFGVGTFPGANRFLEIGVRPVGGGAFTTLSPRQQISSTPYAIRTLSAATADTATNATQLGGINASQYVQTNDTRLTDSRPPTAGSSNYIQNNPASEQSGANFNIQGSGTVGTNLFAGNLAVFGNANVGATLTMGGNVGIGTGSPGFKLHLAGHTNFDWPIIKLQNVDPGGHSYWLYGGANGIAQDFGIYDETTARYLIYINQFGRVGIGTTSPQASLHVAEDESGDRPVLRVDALSTGGGGNTVLQVNTRFGNGGFGLLVNNRGEVTIGGKGAAGSEQLCLNSSFQIAACSSSLRYKSDVAPFVGGLDIVNRLRPINFTWKQGGMRDIGFGAEEVEKVEPLLTFRNDNDQLEGVKYNQLSAVFVNAIKEQQKEIEQLRGQIRQLRANAHRRSHR